MKRYYSSVVLAFVLIACIASVGAAITYEYDGLNRLVRVTYDDDTAILYEYDAAGNRTLRVLNGDSADVYLSVHVDPPDNGVVIRNPDQTWYPLGTPVELTAVADGDCQFDEWTGDVPGGHEQDNPLNITLDAYKSVIVHFTSPLGDADCDCDLDLADFVGFQLCFDESPVSDECAVFDFDENDTIDLADFASFEAAFTGPA